jgi:hypothetical protein
MQFNYNHAVGRELVKLISQEIERLLENLSYGQSITNYEQYKQVVGEIAGLRKAAELYEEAILIVERGSDKGERR